MKKLKLIEPTNQAVSEDVRALISAAYSPNTRRAYQADVEAFLAWGGSVPSRPEEIARYIAENCPRLSVTTMRRRLSALATLHATLELAQNPIRHPLVSKRPCVVARPRTYGTQQRAVEPLLNEDLRRILAALGDRPLERRDKALLCLGFAGGFRRSELVALDFEDLSERPEGLIITIRKSKTDQEQSGRVIGIPFGRGRWCPVQLVMEWAELLDANEGPIFRSCAKGGRITHYRLSPEAVSKVVKCSVQMIGLKPKKFSGHSLRAGFVTSAVKAGVRNDLIRQQTGHASDATMARYVRFGSLFTENALSGLF